MAMLNNQMVLHHTKWNPLDTSVGWSVQQGLMINFMATISRLYGLDLLKPIYNMGVIPQLMGGENPYGDT